MSNEKNVLPLQRYFKINAIVAQLVEQRIRNAWVAGSSPASGSKQKDILYGCLFVCHLSRTRTVKGSPKRSWRFGEERVILECLMPQAAVYARKYGERQSPASGSNKQNRHPCGCLFCFSYYVRSLFFLR